MHVEDEDLAVLETGEPELTPVVGEAAMMRFVAALDGNSVNDFAVGGRAGPYVDGDKLVHAIAQTFNPERPNIDKLLLALDASEVGRRAGFIGARGAEAESECERAGAC